MKYHNVVLVKDDFLVDYNNFLIESEKSDHFSDHDGIYPGIRSKNMIGDGYKQIVKSAVDLLCPENTDFDHNFHYHLNTFYEDAEANEGWIHSDSGDLTGLVYLTPYTIDFTAGTTFFTQKHAPQKEDPIVREFFKGCASVSDYVASKKVHNNQYALINDVPYVTNRLVLFDSRLPHTTKNYKLQNGFPRKYIIFSISFK
jgi:hypothetical protein